MAGLSPMIVGRPSRRVMTSAQRFLFGGLGDDLEQLGVLPRLGDEVVGAETHGLHRRLDVGVAGEDDQLGVYVGVTRPPQDVQPGMIGKLDIDEGHVELFARQVRHRLAA
jgi:hypothetical protein